jgi:hypothetical protein
MSFLPHAPSRSMAWFGALATSAIMHICTASFFLFSGAIVFLREIENLDVREASFEVSFQILDLGTIDQAIPIEEISDNAMAMDPGELEASIQDTTFEALAPVYDTLMPDAEINASLNSIPLEITPELGPEILTSEMLGIEAIATGNSELGIIETEVLSPEVIEQPFIETQLAEIASELIVGTAPTEVSIEKEEIIEPEFLEVELELNTAEIGPETLSAEVLVTQEVISTSLTIDTESILQQPIAIEDLSPINDSPLSPFVDTASELIVGAAPTEVSIAKGEIIEQEFLEVELELNTAEIGPETLSAEVLVTQEVISTSLTIDTESILQQPIAIEDLSPINDSPLSPFLDSGSFVVLQDVFTKGSNDFVVLSPKKETDLPAIQLQKTSVMPTLSPGSEPNQPNSAEDGLVPKNSMQTLGEELIGSSINGEVVTNMQSAALAPQIQQSISIDRSNITDEKVLLPGLVDNGIPQKVVMPTLLPDLTVIEGSEEQQDRSDFVQSPGMEYEKYPEKTDDKVIIAAVAVPQRLSNPTVSDISIGKLLRLIRTLSQPQCTLALPRRAAGISGAGVSLIGADAEQLQLLGQTIKEGLDFEPELINEIIDTRQCAVLDALRQSSSYPANRIGLSLENSELESGNSLRGSVIGAGGLYLTLVLIDDNGIVQDVAPYVTMDGNLPVFDAPVARFGSARATRQMLVALGTKDKNLDFSSQIGREAQDVFTASSTEQFQQMVFGVATFDIQ